MGTTNAQAHGGLATAQANNMKSAKPDTRTVDFSRVTWAWNAARTHLEPDSFPDARVRSGSNVWRRDSGTGLIRIFSDTDLSGMSFSTSGSSWPLSMRRAGLYVSNISGDDVERIRAGGGIGGRADEPTAINCWASEAGKEVTVDAVGASIETPVEVTCNRSIDLPDDEAVVKTAAVPSASPDWIDLIHNRYALRVPAGRSVYVDVILYPDDNGTSARVGNVVWPPVPSGEMASLSALVVHQPGRTVGSDNPPIILICLEPSSSLPKRPGPCPDRVEVGSTVSLRAIVTPPPSGYVTEEVNGRRLHLARRSLEGLGDGRSWAPEQRREECGEVDKPLPCGADHAGEDLLGLRAPGCPIAATDFTVDDGGANGVFGTPVGGLHLGRPQEGEHGSELAVEMGGDALGGRQGGRRVEESSEARAQAPAGHGEAVLGDRVRLPSITECEGVGEDRLHAGCPRTARMIRGQGARSAHQVRQTRLMQRRREAAIRRPPVSHQDAVKVGAQHLGRLVEAAPVANAIHRSLRRGKRPQPVPHRADPPAGLVGAHDGTAADLCAQRGVGRGGHAGRAMQHLHEPPGRHRQPEALPQECGHLGEWHADLLVQARNQCDGARPQVDVGGPHRIRGLQRMATLHAAPALCALPDGHMKAPDDRPDDGEIFLVLRRHALQCHHPAAPRTRRRERGLVGRINPGGNRAARPAPIPAAGSSARLPAVALGPILGERRGLPEPRPPRGCKLLLQALVLPLQSIVLTLQALVLTSHLIPLASQLIPLPLRSRCHLPQPRDLLAVLPDLRVPIGSGTRALIGHAILMTDSCE